MKIENQIFDRIAKAAQDIYKKTGRVFADNTVKNEKGVIYGGDSADTPVFAGENTKAEEIGEQKQPEQLAKDAMDYLSNTMSMEDYEKYLEEYGELEDTEVETIVTVVDKIRISLATYCEDYEGELDGISREAIEKIVGNPALASAVAGQMKEQNLPVTEENLARVVEAVSMAESLEPVNSSTALYLLQNHLKPTIENVYIAEHSVGSIGTPGQGADRYVMDENGGYYSKTGAVEMTPELQKQMEKVIEAAGMEVNEVTMEAAQWMMQNGLPLTEENLLLADRISQVALPQDMKKLVESIVTAMSGGEKAVKASLSNGSNYVRRAAEAMEVVQQASPEDVKGVIGARQELTVENLAYQEKQPEKDTNIRDTDVRLIAQYRQVEELRLKMTLEASVRLLRSGVDIETMPLSKLVDRLKQVEEDYYAKLLQGEKIEANEEHIERLSALSVKVAMVKTVPAYVIGTVLEDGEATIQNIHRRGVAMKEALQKAGETYEALMTAPRADMGDSIQKAFGNVDDILTDLGLELSDQNARAVRILGYNSMAITEESIMAVKAKDAQVQSLLKNLTPDVAMEMIRENINPLDMEVETVNRLIGEMKENLNQGGEEKYSRFLWKLEQSQDITPAEREAYVGIYRLLHQVEKSDGAVIGSLMEQNMECTLKNLMTCVRIRRHGGVDTRVDDATGGLEAVYGDTKSVTEQIERGYYGRLAERGIDLLEPGRLKTIMEQGDVMDMSLEKFVGEISRQPENLELKERYFAEQMQRIEEARQTEQQVIRNLQRFELPVTIQNITSMEGLMYGSSKVFRQIFGQEGDEDTAKEGLEELAEQFPEALTDKETMGGLYRQVDDAVKKMSEDKIMKPGNSSLDVRAIKTLHSQWSMVSRLSRDENYFIPLKTKDGYTGIHLTLTHKDDVQGKISISMEETSLGNVSAEFYVNRERISGYVATDSREGREVLQGADEAFSKGLKAICENVQIDYVFSKEQGRMTNWEPAGGEGIKTGDLYKAAKAFVENIRNFV